jgi:glycosyltransferase involved in cell wall biosynthesis
MRVVIVTAFPANPELPRGGVEAVSVTLLGALTAFPDLDLHVVTVRRDASEAYRYSWMGVEVHVLPRRGRRMLTSAIGPDRRQVLSYIKGLAPDLVHAHDTFGLMVKGLDVPRILTIHGFIHSDTLVSGTRWARLRSRAWRRVEHAAWADYPHIISISPYVRQRLAGVAKGAIHDIDNPIDARFFYHPRTAEAADIFSAAVISRRKNTLGLVEGLARLRARGVACRLRLAGAVQEPQYHADVLERIHELGLRDAVTLLGPIGRDKVMSELSRATVFALISREENAPIGIEEAMAMGVPVVTSNRCGMPYMVSDGETGFLVDPENTDEVVDRLARVLGDASLRSAMGLRGRQVALERFHPDLVALRTREVYHRAIGASVPAQSFVGVLATSR